LLAFRARELETFIRHGRSPWWCCFSHMGEVPQNSST
jgi:hypothetical protein